MFKISVDSKGYPYIRHTDSAGKRVKLFLHVLVWEYINGKKPEGYDIHHINKDKLNFNPYNLELVSKKDHAKIHAGWVRDSRGIFVAKPCLKCMKILPLENFYSSCIVSAKCKSCTIEIRRKYVLDNIDKVRETNRKSWNRRKQK